MRLDVEAPDDLEHHRTLLVENLPEIDAIARALVKRAEIYVFDDSFSALDLTTDRKLRQALRRSIPTS